MTNDNMEVDAAEAKLQTMAHSEQHYFKRLVASCFPGPRPLLAHRRPCRWRRETRILTCFPVMIIMVSVDNKPQWRCSPSTLDRPGVELC